MDKIYGEITGYGATSDGYDLVSKKYGNDKSKTLISPLSKSLTTVPTGILIISSFPLAPELRDLLPL